MLDQRPCSWAAVLWGAIWAWSSRLPWAWLTFWPLLLLTAGLFVWPDWLVPGLLAELALRLYLGFYGAPLARAAKTWDSPEHFDRVQRTWVQFWIWAGLPALALLMGLMLVLVLVFLRIFNYLQSVL